MGKMVETAVPSEWHGTPPSSYSPPPVLGQHSAEVLKGLGYGDTEIARLMAEGVTAAHAPSARQSEESDNEPD